MSRPIKFRGKRVDNGEWVYGYYHAVADYFSPENIHSITTCEISECGKIILTGTFRVIPESVGQFTGLHDKNGKEIYEGDKVTCRQYFGGNWVEYVYEKGYVGFKNGSFCLVREQGFYRPLAWLIEFDYEIEVIGNIYDNPSLLEVQP